MLVVGCIIPTLQIARPIKICGWNCRIIYQYIRHYNNDYDEKLISNKWCDILIQKEGIGKEHLICYGARRKGDKGPCNYAINPYCEPNSPNDIVLLFETKGGWNQYGGPELISFNNHVRKGANVLFKDGHVEFVKPEDVNKLKWK